MDLYFSLFRLLHSSPNILLLIFVHNFDNKSNSKYFKYIEKIKYNIIYYIMYFKYIFDFPMF
jgi:hypothetical protein